MWCYARCAHTRVRKESLHLSPVRPPPPAALPVNPGTHQATPDSAKKKKKRGEKGETFDEWQRRRTTGAKCHLSSSPPTASLPHPHPVSKSPRVSSRSAATFFFFFFWIVCVRKELVCVGRAVRVPVLQLDTYDVQCELLSLAPSGWKMLVNCASPH